MQYVGEIAHKLNKRFDMRRTGFKHTVKHGFSMKITAKMLLASSTY